MVQKLIPRSTIPEDWLNMSFGGLDLLVGSVNGLLKGIQLSENASNSVSRNINSVKDEDKVEVTCLAPGLTKETLLMGGADGTVKTLKLSSKPDLSIETLLTSRYTILHVR